MSARAAWAAERPAFEKRLSDADVADAARLYVELWSRLQYAVMSEQENESARQMAGLIAETAKRSGRSFEAACGSALLPETAEKPTKIPFWQKLMRNPLALYVLLCVTAGLCASDRAWLGLIASAASLGWAAYVLPLRAKRADAPRVRAERIVDAPMLLSFIDRQCADVDRAVEEAARVLRDLPSENALEADPAVPALCQRLWEAEHAGGGVGDCLRAATECLEREDMALVVYEEANAPLFDRLPTKGETRTIRPAIVRATDRTPVARGLAVLREKAD